MADGIDAAVYPVEPTRRDSSAHRPLTESELNQLPQSNDPVLALGEGADLAVNRPRARFRHSSYRNRDLTNHAEIVAPERAPFTAVVKRLSEKGAT